MGSVAVLAVRVAVVAVKDAAAPATIMLRRVIVEFSA
jgi:hypothetical protein